jgi:predicted PurR-regulated permease PerM
MAEANRLLLMDHISPNRIRQVLFLGIILILFWVLWGQLYFMFSAMLGAIALYVLLRKFMIRLILKKWPRPLAALLLMVLSLVVLVLPFAWLGSILFNRVLPFALDPTFMNNSFQRVQAFLKEKTGADILSERNFSNVLSSISSLIPKLLGSTLLVITNVVLTYFLLYFMLVNCNNMELWLRKNLPLKNRNSEKLLTEVRGMVLSNAIGIPVLAAVQGIIAIIGYMIFGVEEPVLWGIITGVCSVVPVVGTMAAWIPIMLYQFASGNNNGGIGILFWGLIPIGASDNVIRFLLQKRLADIHPIITVVGVIIGVNLFGFIGLIYGPLLISLFLLLVRIYTDEFVTKPDTPASAVENVTVNPVKDAN